MPSGEYMQSTFLYSDKYIIAVPRGGLVFSIGNLAGAAVLLRCKILKPYFSKKQLCNLT